MSGKNNKKHPVVLHVLYFHTIPISYVCDTNGAGAEVIVDVHNGVLNRQLSGVSTLGRRLQVVLFVVSIIRHTSFRTEHHTIHDVHP